MRADTGQRCTERATDADHIGEPTDHRIEMLRAKCGWHHRQKTSRDAGRASAAAGLARHRALKPVHPGLLLDHEIPADDCPF